MIPILDQNNIYRKFNFSSLFTDKEDKEICRIVKEIIDSGNYYTNSPKYQTKENVFGRQEEIWMKLRMTFVLSVFLYLGREVKISNVLAWSFMTNHDTAENRDNLWHNHLSDPNKTKLSGIYYAYIPDDVRDYDTCGTEFAPNGVDAPERFFVRPAPKTWLIYPSKIWHRPGIIQSHKNRFVVACDVELNDVQLKI